MNITIHRGANQIGGCITEISSSGCKILIDFGSNLPGSKQEDFKKEQVEKIACDADAVFYTHYHGDHTGLHHLIPASVKQYIGEGAKEVMLCKYKVLNDSKNKEQDYTQLLKTAERMQTYKPAKPIIVGSEKQIIVTPYFVSHSAFDAYMFKVECEGKKILHTGDFRRHGYLGKGLFPMLEKYVGEVDILITEGTMLGRKQEKVVSEYQIKCKVAELLREHKYVFALCSSTDIDRLASFHVACKETGRIFYVDEFQSNILDIFTKYAGEKSALYKFDNVFKSFNLFAEKVKDKLTREGFLMPIRMSSIKLVKAMLALYNDEQPWLIYSMWNGYAELDKPYTNSDVIEIRNLFEKGRISDGTKDGVHTSGHADTGTLSEVCKTVNPRIGVIPIHKEEGTQYESLPDISGYRIFHEGKTEIENIAITIR